MALRKKPHPERERSEQSPFETRPPAAAPQETHGSIQPNYRALQISRRAAVREAGFVAGGRRLARLGPAFGEGEGAGAERAPFAFQRPGLAFGFDAVAREPRTERRDQ